MPKQTQGGAGSWSAKTLSILRAAAAGVPNAQNARDHKVTRAWVGHVRKRAKVE